MTGNLPALVHPNEKKLFGALLILASIVWFALTVITFGGILLVLLVIYFFGLFAQSRFISYLLGTGAIISEKQFPEIHQLYEECCKDLKIKNRPMILLLHGDGVFNALATRFLRKHYVVLLSDVVDALEEEPQAIKFYIGHELGHVLRNHLVWDAVFAPVAWLPLIGAGYARACEMTCDMHGLHCAGSKDSAVKGMAALAVGAKKWKSLNVDSYVDQKSYSSGFWMSLNEITSDYPWLIRRISLLKNSYKKDDFPKRNMFACLLSVFLPRFNIVSLIVLYLLVIVTMGISGFLKGGEQEYIGYDDSGVYQEEYYDDGDYYYEEEQNENSQPSWE